MCWYQNVQPAGPDWGLMEVFGQSPINRTIINNIVSHNISQVPVTNSCYHFSFVSIFCFFFFFVLGGVTNHRLEWALYSDSWRVFVFVCSCCFYYCLLFFFCANLISSSGLGPRRNSKTREVCLPQSNLILRHFQVRNRQLPTTNCRGWSMYSPKKWVTATLWT